MIKLLGIILLLLNLLDARENPFFPAKGEMDMPLSSNITQKQEPLKRATLTLPSTARTLQKVTVSFKNLDGSIEKKSIILNNSVDWHLPLFVSQNYGSSPSEPSRKQSTLANQTEFKKLASLPFISLFERSKELKIATKDEMIRSFLLVKPHRIVCDFKREIDIRSYLKKIDTKSIVKRIRVGNHKGYYRVVIELDGYYRYKVEKLNYGYLFRFL
jgi:hypothetical protein